MKYRGYRPVPIQFGAAPRSGGSLLEGPDELPMFSCSLGRPCIFGEARREEEGTCHAGGEHRPAW
jgi:hypothetical protein